jgi:hypothetical protein
VKDQEKSVGQENSVNSEPVPAEEALSPLPRHEVEPTTRFALTPGPGKDSFLFYHVKAAKVDLTPLWAHCRYCVSNLVWVNDHFVVTPNPCYVVQSDDFEERFGKIKKVLLFWYEAKGWLEGIDLSGL